MHNRFGRLAVASLVGALVLGTCAVAGASTAHRAVPQAKKTYIIAYEGPLSGGDAQLGLNMKFSVELAINQANAGKTFGALPFKLKYGEADDQGSATQSPAAAQSLVNNSQVVAVVGPAFSGATKAAEPIFSQAHLATVSPSATAPALATQGWHNFFRVVADDNAQGPADALYLAKALHYTKVYSIDDASAYAAGLVTAFDGAAKTDGMTVTHDTAPGTTQCSEGTGNVQEYGAEATKVESSGAKAVFYAGYYCGFALLAKALRAAGYTGQLMSDDGSLDPHYIAGAGKSVAAGTVISCACADITKDASATSFVNQFKAVAKFPVGTYSAEAYDATNAIISVMKGLGRRIDRAAIVGGLHSVNYSGITKVVHFQANGNIAGTAVYVYKVQGGNITQLGLVSALA